MSSDFIFKKYNNENLFKIIEKLLASKLQIIKTNIY